MDIHHKRADARPLWLRFALDEPQEAEVEVGPATIEALGELERGAPDPAEQSRAAPEGAWARLARALDLRRHARALANQPSSES